MSSQNKIYLSQNFTEADFTRSATAQANGLNNNMPNQAIRDNAIRLCTNYLELIWQITGISFRIASGYRSPAVNKLVGGEPNSFHQLGLAADIVPIDPKVSLNTFFNKIKELAQNKLIPSVDQVIYYPKRGFIHFGIAGIGQIARKQFFSL